MEKLFRSVPIEIKLGEPVEGSTEPTVPNRIQILKTGTFYDKRYGTFKITSEMLRSMKKNFDEKILGVDPAIDVAHESDKDAAGWPRRVELANNDTELWGEDVEWSDLGKEKLLGKRYRYISADIDGNYENNETRKKFGPTLKGAGLTNRPVLKGMQPVIQLTEGKENEDMELQEQVKDLEKQLSEKSTKLVALESENAALKKENGDLKEREQNAAKDKKLAEKKSKFDLMLSEKKVVEAQREAFMADDMEKFVANAMKLNEGKGHGGEGNVTTLSEDEKAMCAKLGLSEEDYKKYNA